MNMKFLNKRTDAEKSIDAAKKRIVDPAARCEVERVDGELAGLADRERDLHARHAAAASIGDADQLERQIGATRQSRVTLLMERNHALAGELRSTAARLRKEAAEILATVELHLQALRELEGIAVDNLPNRKSEELERQARRLESEAHDVANAKPRGYGNVRADSFDELLTAVFAELTVVPPTIASVQSWCETLDRQRFGRLAPECPRRFHLIWEEGEIDVQHSTVWWRLAEAVA